ncbi:CASP PIMP1 [Olea europaea subsp. europaea]|uniref:CASP-like protein n=1 Tax=Olea europaea subsp. europaea TaxID=158383 RepID=A0A8S0TAU9_OLEEU|nr:CASP PIMP1 [Olea europaea subsp. europaea]CAA3016486.1 CASP PIMP1 [Olea europaea subsp. europaea]
MAPPPSTVVSSFVSLVVRILTFVCLIISLILLTTATGTASNDDYGEVKIKFKHFKAFRYLCAATVIGLLYTLLQTALTVFHVSTGNRFGGDGLVYIDFYGDKVVSFILATGGAASFGMTQDFKNLIDIEGLGISHFIRTTEAAASLCLLGFLFVAISSIFSSFALPKRA